jgi:hypothetical protein
MVEATQRRMLLEPVQRTQSPDTIVFQNGVLNLKELDAECAFRADEEAPLKYSHAVWSYFKNDIWQAASKLSLMSEDTFKGYRQLVAENCPVFHRFMCDWFPDDTAAYEIVLRWFGYSMTTDTSEQKFVFFYGPTRAGKGSLARLLCGIVGSNNYSVANYSAFEDKFQAVGMHDRLVVTMEEVEATPKEHERRLGMLKKYLGGERIVWEQKYERGFEDEFIGKIIMQSNEVLAYEDKGRSITARMMPMEFTESFFGSGADAPERLIFEAGEGNAIATISAMAWYRMKRNRVRGCFDFRDEGWSIKKSRSCRLGEGSLLLESHKIGFKFVTFFSEKEVEKESIYKLIKKRKLVTCTRNRLKDLTELLLDYTNKKPIVNLSRILCDAVAREWPHAKETCYKIKDVGRCRGWRGLYIDVRRLREEYPELFDNVGELDDRARHVCG